MNRYKNIKTFSTEDNTRYRTNPIYPRIPESSIDFYIVGSVGDRYDTLALKFYGNSKYWWVIASANNIVKAGMVVDPGVQIRIPGDLRGALELFDRTNSQ